MGFFMSFSGMYKNFDWERECWDWGWVGDGIFGCWVEMRFFGVWVYDINL